MRTSLTAQTKALAVRALGTALVERSALGLTNRRLRILAYHGIPYLDRFALQMEHLAREYVSVGQDQVLAALAGEAPLPHRAVWVTFDDGHPEVVTQGQAVLDRLGVRATLFVCPGMVDTDRPFWWEVVEAALALGIRPAAVSAGVRDGELALHMKTLPDVRRRALVAELEEAVIERTGQPLRRRQITEAELRGWVGAGHGIGNHTWDHPCLDRCDPQSQREQVAAADRWLRERWPPSARVFAYPNGNWSPAAEDALIRHGYRLAVLFDHRLSRISAPPLRLSRLRISSDAPLSRFRSILSGTHSSALGVGARLRLKPASADAPR